MLSKWFQRKYTTTNTTQPPNQKGALDSSQFHNRANSYKSKWHLKSSVKVLNEADNPFSNLTLHTTFLY